MPSPDEQRARTRRAERLVAAGIIEADHRDARLDEALDVLYAYITDHPDASPDEVEAAVGPVLAGAIDAYIGKVWLVLAEVLPAATEA